MGWKFLSLFRLHNEWALVNEPGVVKVSVAVIKNWKSLFRNDLPIRMILIFHFRFIILDRYLIEPREN